MPFSSEFFVPATITSALYATLMLVLVFKFGKAIEKLLGELRIVGMGYPLRRGNVFRFYGTFKKWLSRGSKIVPVEICGAERPRQDAAEEMDDLQNRDLPCGAGPV